MSIRTTIHVAFALSVWIPTTAAYADRLLLQVEEFDGPWRRQTNISGYLGQGFCTSNANPDVATTAMRKTVRIDQGGRHVVWLRGYTSANSPRAMQMEVAGERLAVTHKDTRRRWIWEKAGEVQVEAGPVEVIVHDADVGFETADAVLLTDDADEDPMADERLWSIYPNSLPDKANALRFNIDACVALTQKWSDPENLQQWEARRAAVGPALRRALGFDPWPEKTPLDARITGRSDRETYVIENLLFQSKPHFYVTANVYIPKEAPRPLPAIVVTAGHAMQQGKNYDLYRTAQLGLVHQGFLVLAYDPVGQGERRLPGNSHDVSYAALFTGKSNLHYMVWDSIRAVDYLLTRDDVDPSRIGLTGNSGGGLNTMYTMPVEPRFAVGASFCCLCSYEAWLADGGNHCICSHLPGVCREFEEFEFVGLCAPRPFLAGNGAKDPIFPVAGVRKTIDRARKIYALYDGTDRVNLQVAPLPHGWSGPLREAAYGWFDRWLQDRGDGAPRAEPELELGDWQSIDLRVLKDGKMPDDAKTYVELVREDANQLIASYPPVPDDEANRTAWTAALRQELWKRLGGEPQDFEPTAESLGKFKWNDRVVERLAIQTEKTLDVPALLIRPEHAPAPLRAVVMLDDEGKQTVRRSKVSNELLDRGIAVLALDVRGLGEVRVHENHCASDAIVLGRPMLAQQAWDVMCAVRCLASREDIDGSHIAVYGCGNTGVIATLAGALTHDIAAAVAEGCAGSFVHTIADPLPNPRWIYAPNILEVADLAQLIALCANRRFLLVNPVGLNGAPLPEADVDKLLGRVGSPASVTTCIEESPLSTITGFLSGDCDE